MKAPETLTVAWVGAYKHVITANQLPVDRTAERIRWILDFDDVEVEVTMVRATREFKAHELRYDDNARDWRVQERDLWPQIKGCIPTLYE